MFRKYLRILYRANDINNKNILIAIIIVAIIMIIIITAMML